MKNRKHTEGLDEVLASYAEASVIFDARVLHDYVRRFPQFADALNRYAQVQLSSVRATVEEIADVELTDEEMLPRQSKLLECLQQLRPALSSNVEEVKEATKQLAAIKGLKATEAATLAVFGTCQQGQDDLFLLVTEPPGVKDVPDWVYSRLGNHIGLSVGAVRAGIASRMAAGVQRFSASGKPTISEPLAWEDAVTQSITDEATRQAILKDS